MSVKDRAEKPAIGEFALGEALGEGNFSRIVRATHRTTGEQFALKTIEKARIKRLRIRHPNIFNEINMEKDVLNRLRHPNIIRLYHTFQDDVNLYFLLELLDGGELLEQLNVDGRQMPLHEDLARFYLADIINAVDYLHGQQILHRDLKPENMVVCKTDGHIRLIDFGTAKNLANPALNGPNFVGTPEYMPPEVIDNKEAGTASDLWAIGCIVYQLLTGEPPFSGGSAYLTFLRTQDGTFHMPSYLSDEAQSLITSLLQKDPADRPDMSTVKAHPFFKGVDFTNHMSAVKPSIRLCGGVELFEIVKDLEQYEKARKRNRRHADYGSPEMLQTRVCRLTSQEKSLLMHILYRKQVLHLPGIYPRFFGSAPEGRCRYAVDHKYVGLSHDLQNQWNESFSFMQLAGPRLGKEAAAGEKDGRGGSTWETEKNSFRQAIATINRNCPAFVAIIGDFVNASPDQHFYHDQLSEFQGLVNEIDPEVRLVFVAGPNAFEHSISNGLEAYETAFGSSWFSFWFGGMKFIVLNSSLLAGSEQFGRLAAKQEDWLKKELENGKLCARGTAVFMYRSTCVDDDKQPENLVFSEASSSDNQLSLELTREMREKYSKMISEAQTCVFASAGASVDCLHQVVTKVPRQSGEGEDDFKCELIHCQSPWDTNAAVFVTKVSQSGIIVGQFHPEPLVASPPPNAFPVLPSVTPTVVMPAPAPSKVPVDAPEDQDHDEHSSTTLAAEVVAMQIAS